MSKIVSLRKRKTNKNSFKLKNTKIKNNFSSILEHKNKILFTVISVIGIFIGVVLFKISDNAQLMRMVVENFSILNNGSFKEICIFLLKIDFAFMLVSFFIGTSFIGSSISFLPILLKCLYIGYLCGYLYNQFELKGVLFSILLLYPCFAITLTSLIFASNENIYMSKYIYKSLNGKLSINDVSIKLYLIRYLLLIILNVCCVVISSLAIYFIAPKINIT